MDTDKYVCLLLEWLSSQGTQYFIIRTHSCPLFLSSFALPLPLSARTPILLECTHPCSYTPASLTHRTLAFVILHLFSFLPYTLNPPLPIHSLTLPTTYFTLFFDSFPFLIFFIHSQHSHRNHISLHSHKNYTSHQRRNNNNDNRHNPMYKSPAPASLLPTAGASGNRPGGGSNSLVGRLIKSRATKTVFIAYVGFCAIFTLKHLLTHESAPEAIVYPHYELERTYDAGNNHHLGAYSKRPA